MGWCNRKIAHIYNSCNIKKENVSNLYLKMRKYWTVAVNSWISLYSKNFATRLWGARRYYWRLTWKKHGKIFFSTTNILPNLITHTNHLLQGHDFGTLFFSKFHHSMCVQTTYRRGKIHWAKCSQFQLHWSCCRNTLALPWPKVLII